MKKEIYVLIDDKKRTPGAKTFYDFNESEFRALNNDGWGMYFAANEFDVTEKQMLAIGAKTKRHNDLVTKLRYVYADLDIAKAGDGMTRKGKEEKKQVLVNNLIKFCEPTKIINTSNGIQPLWELEDMELSEKNKKRYVKVIKGIIEWSKKYGCMADAVQDIARILRQPGFYHQKEEPYLCDVVYKSKIKYTLNQLEIIFPFEEKPEYVPKQNNSYSLSVVDEEVNAVDFQDLVIRAFASTGRSAEFDKQKRLILDGRLTGTFQGKTGDQNFLASSSHEPYQGNRITVVADILSISNKEARKWIMEEYNIRYSELVQDKVVAKQLEKLRTGLEQKSDVKIISKKDYKLRYTWGTRDLDTSFAIIKRTDFIVIGAKRSAGKTIFTYDMAMKNALLGHKILYLSLEMNEKDILEDLARKASGITVEEEYDYKIPEKKQSDFEERIKEIKSVKNLMFEGIRRGENIVWDTILAVIKKYEDLDMVIIDNLDLIESNEKEHELEKQKRIVKNIMNFTAINKVPIILIHHHRKSMAGGKSHGMDELSGSGKIADSADRVVSIKRCTKPNAEYPEKYRSVIELQKSRGYSECMKDIYFIRGTFVDVPPPSSEYYYGVKEKKLIVNEDALEIADAFDGEVVGGVKKPKNSEDNMQFILDNL